MLAGYWHVLVRMESNICEHYLEVGSTSARQTVALSKDAGGATFIRSEQLPLILFETDVPVLMKGLLLFLAYRAPLQAASHLAFDAQHRWGRWLKRWN